MWGSGSAGILRAVRGLAGFLGFGASPVRVRQWGVSRGAIGSHRVLDPAPEVLSLPPRSD